MSNSVGWITDRPYRLTRRAACTMMIVVFFAVAINPGTSRAKGGDEQDQIILLNDSASALEDTDPGLSKSLTQFADEKEKEWEKQNGNKDALPIPITDKVKVQIQERIKLLKEASVAIKPVYPLIAKSLDKMVKDMSKTIEAGK